MNKRLTGFLAGIALVAALATSNQVGDTYLQLKNWTSQPVDKAPDGKALLFVQNGVAKQLVGTSVTTLGSGSGGGGGQYSTIWPPTSIQNPVPGLTAIGPMIQAYLPADTVYNAAVYTGASWRYFPLSKRPFR